MSNLKNGISLEVKLIADGEDEDGNPMVVGLEEAIVQAAVGRISYKIDKLVEGIVTETAKTLVKEKVGEMVDKFLVNPIFETDKWGNPKGTPTTMAEEIEQQFKQHLNEKVSERDGSTDRYGDSHVTRVVWAARKAAKEIAEKLVAEHLKFLREEFTKNLNDRIASAAIK